MHIDKNNQTGEINLSSGHTLILGNKPDVISIEQVSSKLIEDANNTLLSFGLFDYATPNYSTYYPDVTEDDLKPKDVDFIQPVFRMLSETIVSKRGPIDFSKPGVLKKSMQMLVGQSINIDHEMAVGNAIGAVSKTFWQKAYKSKDGVQVPAGINAVLKIDGKSNPRIARGIMMEPPSIHSNSVTVRFKWEPSHKFEEISEFYHKVGTFDEKGKLIRFIVTEIVSYSETSLVSHGADVWAQKIKDDGEINDPKYASRNYQFSADKPLTGNFSLDYKTDLTKLSMDTAIPLTNNNNNKEQIMEKLIKDLTSSLGFEDGVLTEENLCTQISAEIEKHKTSLTDKETELTSIKADLQTSKDNLTALQTKFDSLEQDSEKVEKVLGFTRDEAVRLYKLASGDKAEDNIISLISTANLDTSAAFVKQYQREVDEKFSATCNDCGSTKVTRQTSQTSQNGLHNGADDGSDDSSNRSNMEVRNSLKTKNKRTSRIFKTEDK